MAKRNGTAVIGRVGPAKVQRARGRELSFFQQNDVRREEVARMIATMKRRALLDALMPHEREHVEAFLDRLPGGRNAGKILSGMKRFGLRAASDAGLPPLRLPTTAVANSFKQEILDGTHVAADTYKIALYVAASTIGAATTAYTVTNEVASGGGYTTGGMALTGRTTSLDTGTAILDFTTDPVWSTATITARGCMIYNSTKANRTVSVHDFGADITSTNGNFTVQFPAPTAAAGLVRIA